MKTITNEQFEELIDIISELELSTFKVKREDNEKLASFFGEEKWNAKVHVASKELKDNCQNTIDLINSLYNL